MPIRHFRESGNPDNAKLDLRLRGDDETCLFGSRSMRICLPQVLREFLIAAAVPSVVFFLFTYVSEPGYFQGLVPVFIVLSTVLVARAKRIIVSGTAVVVIQIVILLLPEGGRAGFKSPSIPEIVNREIMGEVLLKQINDALVPGQSALFITDYPGAPLQRQLPLLRANTDVLWLFLSGNGDIVSMSYSNDHILTPIPGPVLGSSSSSATFNTQTGYDVIVLDPFLTNANRLRLAEHCRCSVPSAAHPGSVEHLPVRCFPDGRITFQKYSVVFDNGLTETKK